MSEKKLSEISRIAEADYSSINTSFSHSRQADSVAFWEENKARHTTRIGEFEATLNGLKSWQFRQRQDVTAKLGRIKGHVQDVEARILPNSRAEYDQQVESAKNNYSENEAAYRDLAAICAYTEGVKLDIDHPLHDPSEQVLESEA